MLVIRGREFFLNHSSDMLSCKQSSLEIVLGAGSIDASGAECIALTFGCLNEQLIIFAEFLFVTFTFGNLTVFASAQFFGNDFGGIPVLEIQVKAVALRRNETDIFRNIIDLV